MKKLTKLLSLAVVASSCVFAGGPFIAAPEPDVEAVEPAVAALPEVEPTKDIQPYIGGSLGTSSGSAKSSAKVCGGCTYDKLTQTTGKESDKILNWGGSDSSTNAMALAGVEVNDYLAVEARLTSAVSDYEIEDHQAISFANAAVYLKPQAKFEDFSVYALLGYGISSVDFMGVNTKSNGFQYGAGGSYDISDQISVFADYTQLMGSTEKISQATSFGNIDSINAGVIFKP